MDRRPLIYRNGKYVRNPKYVSDSPPRYNDSFASSDYFSAVVPWRDMTEQEKADYPACAAIAEINKVFIFLLGVILYLIFFAIYASFGYKMDEMVQWGLIRLHWINDPMLNNLNFYPTPIITWILPVLATVILIYQNHREKSKERNTYPSKIEIPEL